MSAKWIIAAVAVVAVAYYLMRRKAEQTSKVASPKVVKELSEAKVAQEAKVLDRSKATMAAPAKAPTRAAPKQEQRSFYEQYLKNLDPTRKENAIAQLADKATGGVFGDVSSVLGSIGRIVA
jgi:hypothetical protein